MSGTNKATDWWPYCITLLDIKVIYTTVSALNSRPRIKPLRYDIHVLTIFNEVLIFPVASKDTCINA